MPQLPDERQVTDIPEATVRKSGMASSLVWLIPLVAAIIGGSIAVKTQLDRGPKITITFRTAEGIEAGVTKVKYNEVDIGLITNVALSQDRGGVIVTAEMDKQATSFLVEDTRFWVVKPRIAGGQVSGLSTLVSGSYIGVDIGKSKEPRRHYTGLERQPIVTEGYPGRQLFLNSEQLGSLDIGAPVYFRHIQVGQVTAYGLDKFGTGVTVTIFIRAPYDRYVTKDTRFWGASGIDITMNADGVRINTEGLVSILVGGIAFETPLDAAETAEPAEENTTFALHATRDEAMRQPIGEVLPIVLLFTQSVRGLSPGTAVDFYGVPVGEVESISLEYDPVRQEFRTIVELNFYPERIWTHVRSGSRPTSLVARKALWQSLVNRGLRAQIRSGNLITGQLYVAFDFFPDAKKPPLINWANSPIEMPTVPSTMEDVQTSLVRLARKLDGIPFEQIGSDLDESLKTMTSAIRHFENDAGPELQALLDAAQKALTSTERILGPDSPLQQDAQETMHEVSRAAEAIRGLADYLERHPESLIRGKQEEQRK